MPKPIEDVLEALRTALAGPSPDYETLIAAFRDLVVPSNVTAEHLTSLYAACYRLLGIAAAGPPVDLRGHLVDWQAGHLTAAASDVVERTMIDRSADSRAWIARSRAGFVARGQPIPEELTDDHLPPRLDIPFDLATASERIRPYLDYYEDDVARGPACHFKFCWEVARDGYPVFQEVVARWARDIERRGIGVPGTVAAIATARVLLSRATEAEPLPWADCERDLLPLLDHAHPMVAAGAGRWLGALCDDGLPVDPVAPPLPDILDRIRRQPRNRAAIAGGFVHGFDVMLDGLAALANDGRLGDFDLDTWVIDCLAAEKDTPYLPNAQALWFYVHEHYDADPAFVGRLIDADRAWIALMCATEIDARVEGMAPLLDRLANDPDPAVAEPARRHRERHY